MLLALVIVSLGKAYLWYIGLPPYYYVPSFIYPGRPDRQLVTKINNLMGDIHEKYPDSALRAKVRRIPKDWMRISKRPGLALSSLRLGLGVLPYVEEMTKSNNPDERLIAYEMLADFNTIGEGKPYSRDADCNLKAKYVSPIWERALYDPLHTIPELAIKRANIGKKGIKVYHRMIRDPDQAIQIEAARRLMRTYNRPDLVPQYLKRLSQESGVE